MAIHSVDTPANGHVYQRRGCICKNAWMYHLPVGGDPHIPRAYGRPGSSWEGLLSIARGHTESRAAQRIRRVPRRRPCTGWGQGRTCSPDRFAQSPACLKGGAATDAQRRPSVCSDRQSSCLEGPGHRIHVQSRRRTARTARPLLRHHQAATTAAVTAWGGRLCACASFAVGLREEAGAGCRPLSSERG